jgi:hypothetical protein
VRIPGLGAVIEDPDHPEFGWLRSAPVAVPVLGGIECRFILDGYTDDPAPEDFHAAIQTFLALDRSVLEAAAPSIWAYYRDVTGDLRAAGEDDWCIEIAGPEQVFDHIRLGDEPAVSREAGGDRHVYVSLECGCDWEEEHGLQIVFRDGAAVTKVGPYDGHLTNESAFADESLRGTVYRLR